MGLEKAEKLNQKKKEVLEKNKDRKKNLGLYSRNKGKRGELEIAHIFTAAGFPSHRGVQYKGGVGSPDVIIEHISKFFHFEVKNVERFNLQDAMKQAKLDCDSKIPFVLHKKARHGWMVSFSMHHFIDILQVILGNVSEGNKLGEIFEQIRQDRRVHSDQSREESLRSDSQLL